MYSLKYWSFNVYKVIFGFFSLFFVSSASGSLPSFLDEVDPEIRSLTPLLGKLKNRFSNTNYSSNPNRNNNPRADIYSTGYSDKKAKWFYDLGEKVMEVTDRPDKFMANSKKVVDALRHEAPENWNSYEADYWITEPFYQRCFSEHDIREHRLENLRFNTYLEENNVSLEEYVSWYREKYPNAPLPESLNL